MFSSSSNPDLGPLRAAVDTAKTVIIALVAGDDAQEVAGADAALNSPVDLAQLLHTCRDVLMPEGAVT